MKLKTGLSGSARRGLDEMDKIVYPFGCVRCSPGYGGTVYRECEHPQKLELFKLYYKPYWCSTEDTNISNNRKEDEMDDARGTEHRN